MDKRAPLVQKFRVGQRCVFAFPESLTWAVLNGTKCVIVIPKHCQSGFWVQDLHGKNRTYRRGVEERYGVRCDDGTGLYVQECDLRPLYDGDALSTWERFTEATGIRLDRAEAAR